MHAIPEPIVIEARARIFWGESPDKVLAYLQTSGVGDKDAFELLAEIDAERCASIRRDGLKKIWFGAFLAALPVATYYMAVYAHKEGHLGTKGFAALIVIGTIGVGSFTTGLWMILRPSATAGDLSNGKDLAV